MHTELAVIEAQVLKLAPADRARLLDRLILILDEDKVRDDGWNAVAAQRDAEIEQGEVIEVDGPAVVTSLRAKYG